MAEQIQQTPQRKSSLITKILGTLIVSLFVSILIEWLGIAFFWAEEGAEHSKNVMIKEFAWLSSDFRQSLLYNYPVSLVEKTILLFHEWVFVKSGIQDWLNAEKSEPSLVYYYIGAYIESTLYVTVVFIIRLFIIVLTSPIFILTGFTGFTDGLVQRDLRKFGVGRESAFIYHYAKRAVGPIMFLAWVIYLSIPFSIHPLLILMPAAIMFGYMIRVTASSFKKYL